MSEKTDNFINTIGVLARNEFLSRDRWCFHQYALRRLHLSLDGILMLRLYLE